MTAKLQGRLGKSFFLLLFLLILSFFFFFAFSALPEFLGFVESSDMANRK